MNETYKFQNVTYIGFIGNDRQALNNATVHLFSGGRQGGNNMLVSVDVSGVAQPIEVVNSKTHSYNLDIFQENGIYKMDFNLGNRKFILESSDDQLSTIMKVFMATELVDEYKRGKKETAPRPKTQRPQTQKAVEVEPTQKYSPEPLKVASTRTEPQLKEKRTQQTVALIAARDVEDLMELTDDELLNMVASLLEDESYVKLIERVRDLLK